MKRTMWTSYSSWHKLCELHIVHDMSYVNFIWFKWYRVFGWDCLVVPGVAFSTRDYLQPSGMLHRLCQLFTQCSDASIALSYLRWWSHVQSTAGLMLFPLSSYRGVLTCTYAVHCTFFLLLAIQCWYSCYSVFSLSLPHWAAHPTRATILV